MEEDRRRRLEKKRFYSEMFEEDLQMKNSQHYDANMKLKEDKDEYNILCQRNAMKQQLKEDNYRNYYRMCMEDQNRRGDFFVKNVLTKVQEREKQIEDKIMSNMDELQRRKYMDELNRLRLRMMQNMDTNNFLKKQIEEKNHMRELEKMERQMQTETRLKELSSYNSYLVQQRRDKKDNASQYRNLLDYQADESNTNRLNANRMTAQEKVHNYNDLQAYKEQRQELHAMIPGYGPQLGGVSNRVNQDTVLQQALERVKQGTGKVPVRSMQNLEELKGGNTVQMTEKAENQEEKSMHESLVRVGNSKRYNENYRYGHNPITNPMPFNVQNPVVANHIDKAYSSSNTRRGVFSSVADRNLVS